MGGERLVMRMMNVCSELAWVGSAAHVKSGRMEKVRGGVDDKIKVSVIAREDVKPMRQAWEGSGWE